MSFARKLGALFGAAGTIDPSFGGAPAGVVLPFAGSAAPTGWLLCYGQAVSRTTYAALFAALGTAYGAGDGSTTFLLPDLRGRVPGGKDDMGGAAASRLTTAGSGVNGATLGATGGAETHTLTTAQLAAHNHTGVTVSAGAHTHPGGSTSGSNQGTIENPVASTVGSTGSAGAHTHTLTIDNAGSGNAHNNTQPTLVLNYIIKT